jgi:hypothetical protein
MVTGRCRLTGTGSHESGGPAAVAVALTGIEPGPRARQGGRAGPGRPAGWPSAATGRRGRGGRRRRPGLRRLARAPQAAGPVLTVTERPGPASFMM